MRKFILQAALVIAVALPVACVTINVYFPEAAADKAAEQFIDQVIGGSGKDAPATEQPSAPPAKPAAAMLLDFIVPDAYAQTANLKIQTPQIQAIQSRMQQRFSSTLAKAFASGAIGFGNDGKVAVRDAASVPLPERAALNAAVADENRDRDAVYREIAIANGHAEWETQIRNAFAKQWVQQAKPGWYYQDSAGAWKQK